MEAACETDHELMHHICAMPGVYYFKLDADDVFTGLRGDVFGVLGYHAKELLGSDSKYLEVLPCVLAKHRDVCADPSDSIHTECTCLRKDKSQVIVASCRARHEDGSCSGIARYMSEAEEPTSTSSMTASSSHELIDAPRVAHIGATARTDDSVSTPPSASHAPSRSTTTSNSEDVRLDAIRVAYLDDSRSTRKIFEHGARQLSWIDSCVVRGKVVC